MLFLSTLVTIPLLTQGVLAGILIQRADGPKKDGHYIIKTKTPIGGSSRLSSAVSDSVNPESITYQYNRVFSGFAGNFTDAELEALSNDPNIEAIYEDGRSSIAAIVTQSDAPWGLERISHPPLITVQHIDPLSYNYSYDDSGGDGVDIYVVDTGINVNHVQFEGRARLAPPLFGYDSSADDNGHGTHAAGTAGSLQFGVAKKVNLIGVKALDEDGNGWDSDIMSAFEWIIGEVATSGRPSVINYSISGGKNSAMDTAAQSIIDAGIHLVAAAGNYNIPVNRTSPGTVPDIIVVGAIDANDTKADFSNYGPEIDVHAPGVGIISTYHKSNTATATLSGTSMAAPHVAGLVAYYIALHGNMSPQAMREYIQSTSIKDVISGLPSGTVNNLAFNSADTLTKRRQAKRGDVYFGPTWSRRDRFAKRRITA